MKKFLIVLLCFLSTALLVTACGGQMGNSSSSSQSTSSPTSSQSTSSSKPSNSSPQNSSPGVNDDEENWTDWVPIG